MLWSSTSAGATPPLQPRLGSQRAPGAQRERVAKSILQSARGIAGGTPSEQRTHGETLPSPQRMDGGCKQLIALATPTFDMATLDFVAASLISSSYRPGTGKMKISLTSSYPLC